MGSRLALGTAQLSGPYGIANDVGQPSAAELARLLAVARRHSVDTIDTAAAYGNAEVVLGDAGTTDFAVISKLAPGARPADVPRAVERSLGRLKRPSLNGLLVHRVELPEVVDLLGAMREQPQVQRVGISVYRPEEVEWLLDRQVQLDIVQAPFSVLDQRFASVLDDLSAAGVEFHARSVFLQGLPFVDDARLGARFDPARGTLRRLRELAAEIPLPTLLLRFVAAHDAITRIVVGVEAAWQLQTNLEALATTGPDAAMLAELRDLAIDDEEIVLPSRWN